MGNGFNLLKDSFRSVSKNIERVDYTKTEPSHLKCTTKWLRTMSRKMGNISKTISCDHQQNFNLFIEFQGNCLKL